MGSPGGGKKSCYFLCNQFLCIGLRWCVWVSSPLPPLVMENPTFYSDELMFFWGKWFKLWCVRLNCVQTTIRLIMYLGLHYRITQLFPIVTTVTLCWCSLEISLIPDYQGACRLKNDLNLISRLEKAWKWTFHSYTHSVNFRDLLYNLTWPDLT